MTTFYQLNFNMMEELAILFEKYNFDYLYINPKGIEYLDWEFIPDETLVDFKGRPGYLGTIILKGTAIEVYYDEKITSGDVIFKYKNIKKERMVKLMSIINNSVD